MVTFPLKLSQCPHVLRQAFIRFDGQGRARNPSATTMARPVPVLGRRHSQDLRSIAAAEAIPSWTAVWSDLPSQKPIPDLICLGDDISRLRYYPMRAEWKRYSSIVPPINPAA